MLKYFTYILVFAMIYRSTESSSLKFHRDFSSLSDNLNSYAFGISDDTRYMYAYGENCLSPEEKEDFLRAEFLIDKIGLSDKDINCFKIVSSCLDFTSSSESERSDEVCLALTCDEIKYISRKLSKKIIKFENSFIGKIMRYSYFPNNIII